MTFIRKGYLSKPFGKLWLNKVKDMHIEPVCQYKTWKESMCVFFQFDDLIVAPWKLIRIGFLNLTNQLVIY